MLRASIETAGGEVDLTGITAITAANTSFFAQTADSLINLSNLGSYGDPTLGNTLDARNGGEIRMPLVTRLDDLSLQWRAGGGSKSS